ncbi:hypothetical protein [Gordonia sp. VNK21]|uniref:P-type ATPase n=1 Tax=Gordonia sp. VNK21 TaxID=3382483 RepID=UPI0038D4C514
MSTPVSARNAGLTSQEVADRVAAGDVNTQPGKTGRSVGQIVWANIFTPINGILGVLFAIVAYTGSLINGLFGLLIVANSGIGMIQEIRAKRTLDRLSIVGQAMPTVRRDGESRLIPPDQVVLGDIIELAPGEQIVVDGETVEAEALDVDESLLTGEADAVDKSPGDEIMSGSFVVSGSGAYRATKVGADAYAAKIAAEASKFTLVSSELRSGINKILAVITVILIPAGALTIYNQLVISRQDLDDALLGMVAALVPMVPEGTGAARPAASSAPTGTAARRGRRAPASLAARGRTARGARGASRATAALAATLASRRARLGSWGLGSGPSARG